MYDSDGDAMTLTDAELGSEYGDGSLYPASNCNDDITDSDFCHTASGGDSNWVRFKFASSDSSFDVSVVNRASCCYDRLIGGNVQILDVNLRVLAEQAINATDGTIDSLGGEATWAFDVTPFAPTALPTPAPSATPTTTAAPSYPWEQTNLLNFSSLAVQSWAYGGGSQNADDGYAFFARGTGLAISGNTWLAFELASEYVVDDASYLRVDFAQNVACELHGVALLADGSSAGANGVEYGTYTVSYTHLTLPTILLV